MLQRLHFERFRCFQSLQVEDLQRINLLVGRNNGGKTALLEGVHLLMDAGSTRALRATRERRGEARADANFSEGGISHLLYGRRPVPGSTFQIRGTEGARQVQLVGEVLWREGTIQQPTLPSIISRSLLKELESGRSGPRAIKLDWGGVDSQPLVFVPGISEELVRVREDKQAHHAGNSPVTFLSTGGESARRLTIWFEDLVLTPDEETVTNALRILEPSVGRIASVRSSGGDRGGFVLSIDNERVPIGSMGDGIYRVLGLILALLQSKGGYLLVDEIDTGLHYTTLVQVWKVLSSLSKELDVQIFATTHSGDCLAALAQVAEEERESTGEPASIAVHRLERGSAQTVSYSEGELRAAARYGVEMR